MNIVFWLFVAVAAFGLWVFLWPVFGGVGRYIKEKAEDLKTEMKDEWEEF